MTSLIQAAIVATGVTILLPIFMRVARWEISQQKRREPPGEE
jgi:hypothetical protein